MCIDSVGTAGYAAIVKERFLTIRIEEDLLGAMKVAAQSERTTATAYLTALLVGDLRKRGLLQPRKRAK
jgi:hypothetical protein